MKKVSVYNTFSRTIEEFIPQNKDRVTMYVCGITSYDECHLGHARCYVVFDVIRRYLEYCGYTVAYVQNFTDIDDKIIQRAAELQKEPRELAEEYIKRYFVCSGQLNLKPADEYPRVTAHIGDIIRSVEDLIAKEYAYPVRNGSVYFSVRKFPGYGKLSKRDIDNMKSVGRIESSEEKQDALDFALWKAAKQDEPSWDSPWGKGRPGWHIECSVMSTKYLGRTLDIHGGGQDLIFPHHENEITQSECLTGKQFVKYWIHNGFVTINKEKMSKSLGNFFTLKDIFVKYDPVHIRYFLLSQHYRKQLDFSGDKLEQVKSPVERLRNAVSTAEEFLSGYMKSGSKVSRRVAAAVKQFEEAMGNDFNTEAALGEIHALCTAMNAEGNKGSAADKDFIYDARQAILDLLEGVLGIRLMVKGVNVRDSDDKGMPVFIIDELDTDKEESVVALVRARESARKQKNWKEADAIRKQLQETGVAVEDTSHGPRVKKIH